MEGVGGVLAHRYITPHSLPPRTAAVHVPGSGGIPGGTAHRYVPGSGAEIRPSQVRGGVRREMRGTAALLPICGGCTVATCHPVSPPPLPAHLYRIPLHYYYTTLHYHYTHPPSSLPCITEPILIPTLLPPPFLLQGSARHGAHRLEYQGGSGGHRAGGQEAGRRGRGSFRGGHRASGSRAAAGPPLYIHLPASPSSLLLLTRPLLLPPLSTA